MSRSCRLVTICDTAVAESSSSSYTPHPTPYTLYTLHPTPSTPYTLHPTPSTLYTLHPTPSTPYNPTPYRVYRRYRGAADSSRSATQPSRIPPHPLPVPRLLPPGNRTCNRQQVTTPSFSTTSYECFATDNRSRALRDHRALHTQPCPTQCALAMITIQSGLLVKNKSRICLMTGTTGLE